MNLDNQIVLSIQDGVATPPTEEPPFEEEEHPQTIALGELHTLAPALDQRFKKPPPDKKRRRPSKGHLKQMAVTSGDGVCVCVCGDSVSSLEECGLFWYTVNLAA